MELDRRISNKLLVGGIFAVLIFGLVGSQQAMAGNGGPLLDIDIDKCVADAKGKVSELRCVFEANAGSLLIEANEGDTVFFRIDAIVDPNFPGVTGVEVEDFLQDRLIFVS